MTQPSSLILPDRGFADRLRAWRRANRIKQEWLAARLGVTQAVISR